MKGLKFLRKGCRTSVTIISSCLVTVSLIAGCSSKPQMPNVETMAQEKEEINTFNPEKTPVTRAVATDDEKSSINQEGVTAFLDALINKDAVLVAEYANSTKEAVDSWINTLVIDSYEIGDCYKEMYVNEYGYDVSAVYVQVKVNVKEGDNRVFHKGENWYNFYGPSAMGEISKITPSEPDIYNEIERVANVCERYEVLVGADFEADNVNVIYEIPYIWNKLREFGYINHDYIASMEDLDKALKDNLGLETIPWDYAELKHEGNYLQDYDRVPRGGIWRFYGVKEITQSKCVIEYYADTFGFSIAETVEYTYKINENGTVCITSVKTIETSDFPAAIGSV